MKVVLASCLLLALLAAPAAALPKANVTYSMVAPDVMEVSIEATTEGQEASGQRRLLDTDKDGNVTLKEVRRSANNTMTQVNSISGAISVPGGRTLLDGREHIATTVVRLEIDAVGPTDLPDPVRQSWLVRLGFAAPANQTFILAIDVGNTSVSGHIPMEVESATIRAPPGHIIAGSGGLPITANVDTTSIVLPSGLPSRGLLEVRFAPGQAPAATTTSAGAPLSPLVAIAAIALALLVSRSAGHRVTSIHKR